MAEKVTLNHISKARLLQLVGFPWILRFPKLLICPRMGWQKGEIPKIQLFTVGSYCPDTPGSSVTHIYKETITTKVGGRTWALLSADCACAFLEDGWAGLAAGLGLLNDGSAPGLPGHTLAALARTLAPVVPLADLTVNGLSLELRDL